MRGRVRRVQNDGAGRAQGRDNSQLPGGSEAGTWGVDDSDTSDSRLPLIIHFNKEGRVLETHKVAFTETAQVQIQQVQYWQGVCLIFACSIVDYLDCSKYKSLNGYLFHLLFIKRENVYDDFQMILRKFGRLEILKSK